MLTHPSGGHRVLVADATAKRHDNHAAFGFPRGGDPLREEVARQPPVGHARRHDAKGVAPFESHIHQ
jgi:hypothetical protein